MASTLALIFLYGAAAYCETYDDAIFMGGQYQSAQLIPLEEASRCPLVLDIWPPGAPNLFPETSGGF